MTDLFVSQDGTDIRICKKDEDGRERCICCVGLMGDYDDNEEPTEETLAEWLYYARLFAQAEKMKEALEDLLANAPVLARDYLDAFRDWPNDAAIQGWEKARWLRAADAKDKARAALAELSETNDEH